MIESLGEELEFTIVMKNHKSGDTLSSKVFRPKYESLQTEQNSRKHEYWTCRFVVTTIKYTEDKIAHGDSWLQALLMAVEGVRRKIPEEEEQDWQTDDGIPSWVILPKAIPIAWGYDFHSHAYELLKREEKILNERISSRKRK